MLASDAPKLHGLTPSWVALDELHAFKDASVYEAMRTAMLKRADSRMIVITTQGPGTDGPLARLHARALAQPHVSRTGALTVARGASLAMLEWSVPEDADVDDPRQVKKANPASWLTPQLLAEQREAVPDGAFRRYHCNQIVEGEHHWLPTGAWQACAGDAAIETGKRVWIGVDVGGERSASAVVVMSEDLRVNAYIYQGDEAVLTCVEKVRELADEYAVIEVVADPWRFEQAMLELEREGLIVIQFPQSPSRMIPASDRLWKAITEGRIVHPNDPDLNRHVASAVAKDSPRGWRVDKAHRSAHIDAVVAMAMALERVEQRTEPVRLLGWL